MTNKYTLEVVREIWDDPGNSEHRVDVGPDRDNSGLVEIRWRDEKNNITERMSFPPEMAMFVGKAMMDCAEEMIENEKTNHKSI